MYIACERWLLARASRVSGAYTDAELAAEVAALDARAAVLSQRGAGAQQVMPDVARVLPVFGALPASDQHALLRLLCEYVEVAGKTARVVWRRFVASG